jgi:hypothetical protein
LRLGRNDLPDHTARHRQPEAAPRQHVHHSVTARANWVRAAFRDDRARVRRGSRLPCLKPLQSMGAMQ